MGATVSRTDKDRPYLVQINDPLNRRFRMVVADDWFWKKMWAATGCWCCSSRHYRKMKRKRRSSWKREVE